MAGIFRNATTYFGNPPSEFGNFSGVQARRSSSLILLPVEDPNPFDKRYTEQELVSLKNELTSTLREAADARRGGPPGGAGAQNAIQNRIRTANILAETSAKLAVVDENGNPRSYCMGVQERESHQDARLLVRGEIDQPAQIVPRGFPQVLCSAPASIDSRSSGRLELAKWIGSEENPLVARVMVNRIWQQLIGQGLVTSTENFGVTGAAPSHPELLDDLAVRFMESGWSVKKLVREIANSRVYRISSTFNEQHHQYDPDNALLWRSNPRRLDAEALRDAMLSVSGEIEFDRPRGSEVAKAGYTRVRDGILGDPREMARKAMETASQSAREAMRQRFGQGRQGVPGPGFPGPGFPGPGFRGPGFRGPGGFAPMGANGMVSQRAAMEKMMREVASKVTNALDMEDAKFRSVYLPIVRDEEPRSLEVFDFADSNAVIGTRESSNTANQALYMMNNRFVIQQSESFARRVANRRLAIARSDRSGILAGLRPSAHCG